MRIAHTDKSAVVSREFTSFFCFSSFLTILLTSSFLNTGRAIVFVQKKVVITGGTGFIGTALAEHLRANNYAVTQLSYGNRGTGWDGVSAEPLQKLIDGAYGVVHLAGENIGKRWTEERKHAIHSSRIESGAALTEAISRCKVKPSVLIQASAIGYYGDTGRSIVTETHVPGDDFLAEVCADWEASTALVEKMQVRRCVMRIAPVLGNGGMLPRLARPVRFYVGGIIGGGRQYQSFVHIKDVVSIVQFFLEHTSCKGVYNVTAPFPVTNRYFMGALGHTLRRPIWLPVPRAAIQLLFGEMGEHTILASQRVVPARLQAEKYRFHFPTVQQALSELYGYR